MSGVTCQVSHVRCHLSGVTCHMSLDACHLSHATKPTATVQTLHLQTPLVCTEGCCCSSWPTPGLRDHYGCKQIFIQHYKVQWLYIVQYTSVWRETLVSDLQFYKQTLCNQGCLLEHFGSKNFISNIFEQLSFMKGYCYKAATLQFRWITISSLRKLEHSK